MTRFAHSDCYNTREVRDVEQTVYGDLLFFVNFCMDFQCLFLTAKLLHRPFRVWGCVIASALGALYACAALFLQTSGVIAFFADCAVCLLMCVIAFAQKGVTWRRLFTPFGVYFGASLAVGGVMSGLASLLSHVTLPVGERGADISSGTFLFLAAFGGFSTFLWGKMCARRARAKGAILHIEIGEKKGAVSCMYDTANLLCDPVGGRPVVLLDPESAKGIVDPLLLAAAKERDIEAIGALPPVLARRVRLIPAGTATGKGMLIALVPDRAFLDTGEGISPVEVLIAPTDLCLKDAEYGGLLPAELMGL